MDHLPHRSVQHLSDIQIAIFHVLYICRWRRCKSQTRKIQTCKTQQHSYHDTIAPTILLLWALVTKSKASYSPSGVHCLRIGRVASQFSTDDSCFSVASSQATSLPHCTSNNVPIFDKTLACLCAIVELEMCGTMICYCYYKIKLKDLPEAFAQIRLIMVYAYQ